MILAVPLVVGVLLARYVLRIGILETLVFRPSLTAGC